MPEEVRGALFPKEEKPNENSPDFSGVIELDGEKIQLVGWKATSQKGQKYISFKKSIPMDDTRQNSYGEGTWQT